MDKAALRTHYRSIRAALSEADHARASADIVARLHALPEVASARTLHAYWPSRTRHEVDLRPLLYALHARGVRIVLPRVSAHLPRHLTHHAWDGGPLAAGAFGLEEPPQGPEIPVELVDVVLVPALAADRHGTRLGYGKGYYDAFLPRTVAFRVVPLFDACLAPLLPAQAHDVPVHALVTQTQTVRISAPRLRSRA